MLWQVKSLKKNRIDGKTAIRINSNKSDRCKIETVMGNLFPSSAKMPPFICYFMDHI